MRTAEPTTGGTSRASRPPASRPPPAPPGRADACPPGRRLGAEPRGPRPRPPARAARPSPAGRPTVVAAGHGRRDAKRPRPLTESANLHRTEIATAGRIAL